MQQKHSPLPWKYNPTKAVYWIDDIEDKPVARLSSYRNNVLGSFKTEKANAQFIVQACNNFEVLLQTCKIALQGLQKVYPQGKVLIHMIEKSIAKAEDK